MKKSGLLVFTIGLGIMINPLNSSMISVALTHLQHDFSLTFADASWLISIFYLASAAGQPVMGKLSDMFGAKKVFMTGLVIVFTACALAPFSPHYIFLLGCRALQAIGSSALFPSGMSIVREYITEGQGRALGTLSIFSNTSAAFGPSIGGFLVASWSWFAIFLINVPIIIIGIILAWRVLPKGKSGTFRLKKIDVIGIGLFIISIVGLILFLLSLDQEHIRWWALIMFLIVGSGFVFHETRHPEPFININRLIHSHNETIIYVQFVFINLVYYCYFFGFPTFLQQVKGYSEEHTGLIMLALAGLSVVSSPIAGRIIDKYGAKLPMIIGAFLLLIGTGLLLTYHETSPLSWFLVIMAVLGMSNGFNNIATQTALYDQVDAQDTGTASGLFQMSRYFGSILSGSLLGIVFNRHLDQAHLHLVAIICFVFCVVVTLISFKLPGKVRTTK